MTISHYLKDIGRGKDGARSLTRAQAADVLGLVLDDHASPLEVGAFCMAMRMKGETPAELAGFLDAVHARLLRMPAPAGHTRTVVLPSYNGARKQAGLTPLLALLLAREGLAVLVHGGPFEAHRISTFKVLETLGIPTQAATKKIASGEVMVVPTQVLCPALSRLLATRQTLGVRNSAHSVVKMMNPCAGPSVVVSSYTHPEFAALMAQTHALTGANGMLLRGTEGEVVADARRQPALQGFIAGRVVLTQGAQTGPLTSLPALPNQPDIASTAAYIAAVLDGALPVPAPIAHQVSHLCDLAARL